MNIEKRKTMLLLLCVICIFVALKSISADASAGSVTGYQKITWGISTGRYYVNGTHAFCAQYNKSWPTVGTSVTRIEPCTNQILRKALYYGYNGPQNTLGTDERAHVLTAIAVSDANIGERETGASAKYDEFYWDLVNNPDKYPTPPENFKSYMAITASDDLQNLAFYEVEKNGFVMGVKTSENPSISDGNNAYSLEGAQYGIYKSDTLTESSKVGTLTMGADGKSNKVELAGGIYYAQEIKAPKGYAKSDKITQFTVAAEKTTTLEFSDAPQVNPIDILLKKVDADTKENKPQGNGTLKGAQFTVQYYKGLWEKDVNPESLGKTPEKTWVFETDEHGLVKYTKEYLVSGDTLYEALPLGTLVIWETCASEGYLLNEETFIRQITGEGNGKIVSTYKFPTVEEKVITYELVIHKKDTNDKPLQGAEFTLYLDEQCQQEIAKGVTDENGILRFQALYAIVSYYVKETKPPVGYRSPIDENGEQQRYEIYEEGMPQDGEVHLDIVNEIDFVLPNTGAPAPLYTNLAGIALCAISMRFIKRKTKRRNIT